MPSFELDVTQPVGDFTITTPEGRITYDVMAITKEPMILFEEMSRADSGDMNAAAVQMIEALSSVMTPQNGGPPAKELFGRLFDDGFLGVNHLREIGEYVMSTAVGSPPA